MIRALTITGITAIAIAISPIGAPTANAHGTFGKIVAGTAAFVTIGSIATHSHRHHSTIRVSTGNHHGNKHGHRGHGHGHRRH